MIERKPYAFNKIEYELFNNASLYIASIALDNLYEEYYAGNFQATDVMEYVCKIV